VRCHRCADVWWRRGHVHVGRDVLAVVCSSLTVQASCVSLADWWVRVHLQQPARRACCYSIPSCAVLLAFTSGGRPGQASDDIGGCVVLRLNTETSSHREPSCGVTILQHVSSDATFGALRLCSMQNRTGCLQGAACQAHCPPAAAPQAPVHPLQHARHRCARRSTPHTSGTQRARRSMADMRRTPAAAFQTCGAPAGG
jgi:hypothetical protein